MTVKWALQGLLLKLQVRPIAGYKSYNADLYLFPLRRSSSSLLDISLWFDGHCRHLYSASHVKQFRSGPTLARPMLFKADERIYGRIL